MNVQLPLVQKPATYADIEALPANMVGELLGGVLYTQARPAPKHARASSKLGVKIGGSFDGDDSEVGGWIILDEPELHVSGDVIVPDLAGWRRERMTVLPDTAYFELVPDWVCEVLSPSTMRLDKMEKRAAYAAMGVTWLWHVDPVAQTLEAFTLRDGQWLLTHARAGDDTCDVPPFDAVPFGLGALWTV